jgi:hypothetical protein
MQTPNRAERSVRWQEFSRDRGTLGHFDIQKKCARRAFVPEGIRALQKSCV